METSLHLILNGSPDFIRGFFVGFFEGKKIEKPLFIEHRHLRNNKDVINNLSDFLSLKKKTHVIINENILPELKYIFSDSHLRIKIIYTEPVRSASFEFQFKAYSKKIADKLMRHLEEIPDEIKIVYSKMHEHKYPKKHSSIHSYELYVSGSVEGEIKPVIELLYRLEFHEIVELGPIKFEVPDEFSL